MNGVGRECHDQSRELQTLPQTPTPQQIAINLCRLILNNGNTWSYSECNSSWIKDALKYWPEAQDYWRWRCLPAVGQVQDYSWRQPKVDYFRKLMKWNSRLEGWKVRKLSAESSKKPEFHFILSINNRK